MKKLFSLFCVVLASATLLAIPTVSKRQTVESPKAAEMSAKQFNVKGELAPENAAFNANGVKKAVADVETDTLFALYVVDNQFVTGTPSSGMNYVDWAQIVVPFSDSVTFYNAYNVPSTPEWEVGDQIATGQTLTIPAGELGGEFDLPTLKYNPQVVSTSDTTATYFKPYQFGKTHTENYTKYQFVNNVLMAPSWLQSVTQCGMYTEYDDSGSGRVIYGDFLGLGEYLYGSNMLNPYLAPDTIISGNDTTLSYHYFDTIMSVVNNSETMYIWQASVLVADFNHQKLFPDSTTLLTMTLLPLSDQGAIDWQNPIAVGYGGLPTMVNYINPNTGTQVDYMGMLRFYFFDEDEAGMIQRVPAIADGSFVVLISGLAQNGVTLGFYTDDLLDDAPVAQTYFPYYKNGQLKLTKLYSFGGLNLIENFYAIWPNVQGLPETVNVPLAGGEFNFTLPSNVWAEDMEIIGEDWIDIEVESVTEGEGDDEEFLYQVKATVTIDAATANRQGEILIDALGKIYTITVNQGTSTSIETVKKVNDGKLYNVLGMEVDENYKGVVIRNGEKFLQ